MEIDNLMNIFAELKTKYPAQSNEIILKIMELWILSKRNK